MSDPTLARGGTNFATSASTTLTLYNTQSEDFKKSANLITMALPKSETSISFDMLGVSFDITVSGTFVETTAPVTVANFISDLNSLIQGNQANTGGAQVGYTFTPVSYGSTITVYVNDVSWTYNAGEPTKLTYSLTLSRIATGSG